MKESIKKKFDSIDKSKIKVESTKELLAKIEKALNGKIEENADKAEALLDKFIAQAKAKNADIFVSKKAEPTLTPTEKKKATQVVKSKLETLMDTIANDPLLKDFNNSRRSKGGGKSDPLIDSERKAIQSGPRVSKKGWKNQYGKSDGGRKYYEYRENRIDRKAPNYGNRPWLKEGGFIHPSDANADKYVVVEIKADGSRREHNNFGDLETARMFASLKREFLPKGSQLMIEDKNGKNLYRSFKSGGKVDESTAMVLSQNKAIAHHTEELKKAISKNEKIEPWVVGKMQRASTDISDVTHYFDGMTEYASGGMMAEGGEVKKDWYDIRSYSIGEYGEDGAKNMANEYIDQHIEYYKGEVKKDDLIIRKSPYGGQDFKGEYVVMKLLPKFAKGGEVGDFFYDSRKDKVFQVIFEDGNKMGLQYLGMDKKPIGEVLKIDKNEFQYNVEKGSWGKWKQNFAKGGKIDNQYEGRSDSDIWNSWTKEQKYHFLDDHNDEFPQIGRNEKKILQNIEYNNILNADIEDSLKRHIRQGQYANGGEVGDFFYDSRKDKVFQVIFEDGNKMGLQYLGMDKKPIGEVLKIDKNEFEYNVEKGSWGKWKQNFAKGGNISTWDNAVYRYLEGKSILIYSMGVKTPLDVKITSVTPPDPKFSIPTLVLKTGNTEERIEGKEKIENLMNGKQVELYDGKEYYAIELAPMSKTKKPTGDYINRRNLVLIVIKNPNKSGSSNYLNILKKDFLDGLHKFEDGGKLSKEYTYIKRADVEQVAYYDKSGKTQIDFKPKNGFWVSKKALVDAGMNNNKSESRFDVDDIVYNIKTKTLGIVRIADDKYGEVKTDADGNVNVDDLEIYNPFSQKYQDNAKIAPSTKKEIESRELFKPFQNASKVKSINFGTTSLRKGENGWKAKNSVDNYRGYDWEITTMKSMRGDLVSTAVGGKTKRHQGYSTFEYVMYQDPNIRLITSKPARITEKVISEQQQKALQEFESKVNEKYAKGGDIGFEGLSKKVAKNYVGDKVKPKYQKEYGKTYDKAEAKEVGNKVASKVYRQQLAKMEEGGKLPEEMGRYFTKPRGTKLISMSSIIPLRARAEGIANAEKNMKMAYDGKMEKRKPITLYKSQGKYRVYDGNSTYAVAKANGWEQIWAEVIKNPNMNTYDKRGNDIFTKAKAIRKEGEAWKDALQRAKSMK